MCSPDGIEDEATVQMTAGEADLEMDRLQHAHPRLEAGTGFNGTGGSRFARGTDSQPWLIASDDLEHVGTVPTTGKQHQPG